MKEKKAKTIVARLAGIMALVIVCLSLFGCSEPVLGSGNDFDPGTAYEDADYEKVNLYSYLHLTYKGKEYSYNSRIITVMFAGVDTDQALTTYNRYSIAPRADAIDLVIFDDYNKKISILSVSRDTIVSVSRYTMNGNYRDNYDTHLGYAYAYGDGGRVSCENLMESLRTLLKGIPIHEYVVTNNGSIGELTELVDGVTVTVPNDDLETVNPIFKKGQEVTLDAETAVTFTRYRDTKIDFSNNGRMERQQVFMSAFFKKFIAEVNSDIEGTWENIEIFSDIYQTSITKNQYLDLAERLKTETFSAEQCYTLKGKNVRNDEMGVDEFYVDEDAMMETLIELFYLEDEK